MKKLLLAALVAVLVIMTSAAPVMAHVGEKAQPKIQVSSRSPSYWQREYTVKLTDSDSPEPISGAEVVLSGEMRTPHHMAIGPIKLDPTGEPGVYKVRVGFPMLAKWELKLNVSGRNIDSAKTTFTEEVKLAPREPKQPKRSEGRTIRNKTQVIVGLGDVNWTSIGMQVIHLILATVWIGGHAFIAVSLRPFLADVPHPHRRDLFARVMKRYSLIAGVSVAGVIGTGLYNALYNVPAPLTVIQKQPLGGFYLGLLVAKIGLLLVASLVGIYAAVAIVPKLGQLSNSGHDADRSGRRMFIASTVNLGLGVAIVTLAVTMHNVHMLIHGHGV